MMRREATRAAARVARTAAARGGARVARPGVHISQEALEQTAKAAVDAAIAQQISAEATAAARAASAAADSARAASRAAKQVTRAANRANSAASRAQSAEAKTASATKKVEAVASDTQATSAASKAEAAPVERTGQQSFLSEVWQEVRGQAASGAARYGVLGVGGGMAFFAVNELSQDKEYFLKLQSDINQYDGKLSSLKIQHDRTKQSLSDSGAKRIRQKQKVIKLQRQIDAKRGWKAMFSRQEGPSLAELETRLALKMKAYETTKLMRNEWKVLFERELAKASMLHSKRDAACADLSDILRKLEEKHKNNPAKPFYFQDSEVIFAKLLLEKAAPFDDASVSSYSEDPQRTMYP